MAFGPVSSVSPGATIRQVLSGESLGEWESFQLLEGFLTSEALALPLAHQQPLLGASAAALSTAITSSGPANALLRVRRRSWDPFAFALQAHFRYGRQQRGGKAISAASPWGEVSGK